MRVLGEVDPGEPEHLPPADGDGVLAYSITLKRGLSAVECPPVDLDRHALNWERNINHVTRHRVIGDLPLDTRRLK